MYIWGLVDWMQIYGLVCRLQIGDQQNLCRFGNSRLDVYLEIIVLDADLEISMLDVDWGLYIGGKCGDQQIGCRLEISILDAYFKISRLDVDLEIGRQDIDVGVSILDVDWGLGGRLFKIWVGTCKLQHGDSQEGRYDAWKKKSAWKFKVWDISATQNMDLHMLILILITMTTKHSSTWYMRVKQACGTADSTSSSTLFLISGLMNILCFGTVQCCIFSHASDKPCGVIRRFSACWWLI